jgi:mannosylglycerate hydrolase
MPLPTPDSQLQGPLRFRFALQPFAGDPSAMAGAARRFLSGVWTYQVSGYEKFSLNRGTPDLPAHYSLFELRSPLVVSAVKKAEDRDALVLRAFNPSARRVAAGALEFAAGSPLGAAQVRISDFAETPGRLLQGGLGGVQAAPQQALTWLIGEDTDTTGSTS